MNLLMLIHWPLESKPNTEFNHAEIVQDHGEGDTFIEAKVPETVDPADANAPVKKP